MAMQFPTDLNIHSSIANYTVSFSDLADLATWHPKADVMFIDSYFRNQLSLPEELPVIWIESNEEAKALPSTLALFEALKQAGIGRGSHLVAIGGGVVQDVATFVASLYMRGISWSYVPTTLLGMADSCLGGKSSINVGSYKNLIGNFYPPQHIEVLPIFARTLPLMELVAGVAEAAKIAFCRGKATFENYQNLAKPVLHGCWTERQLSTLLHTTLAIKQWFIETDEFDQAERRLLNFGHTWGHALESATDFVIPHGVGVALGMMAAVQFVGKTESGSQLWDHCLALLRPVVSNIPRECFDTAKFKSSFRADKKHSPGSLHLIVPKVSGACGLGVGEIQVPDSIESMESILMAMMASLEAATVG